MPKWIDLIDPSPAELHDALPEHVHSSALATLLKPHEHNDDPRPHIVSHWTYVLGILLLPVEVPPEDRLYYQEIDFVATTEVLVTVSKSPPGQKQFDPAQGRPPVQSGPLV